MWEWFSRYPSVQIKDVGTPYVKCIATEKVAAYDYIIVGGMSENSYDGADFQGAQQDVY
jgi:hypothetical protein